MKPGANSDVRNFLMLGSWMDKEWAGSSGKNKTDATMLG